MTDMIEVKTADLIGPALDWAVAVATDYPMQENLRHLGPVTQDTRDPEAWRPSVSWAHGGPLIDKYAITLLPFSMDFKIPPDYWTADVLDYRAAAIDGPTALVAACRAIVVAANLSFVVSVPKELMP